MSVLPPENIAKNTTYLTVALVVQKILSFFFFLFIARTLGNEGTGEYVAAFSLASIFGVFIDLGLGQVLIRELARRREKSADYLSNILTIKLFLSMVVFAALLSVIYVLQWFGQGHPPLSLVILAGAVMIIDSFALTATSIFRGWQNLWFESVVIVLNKIFILSLGVILLYFWPSSFIVALSILIGSIMSILILFYFIKWRLHLSWRLRLTRDIVIELKRLALPFALANIFAAVYAYSDSVLLSILQGNQAVGLYSVAAKTMNAFQFIPSAFMAAVFPAMSSYYRNTPQKLGQLLEQSLRYLLIISAPLAVGLFILADEFVMSLGTDYQSAALAVRILMPSLIFVFLSFPLGSLLNASNHQHWQTALIGFSMAVNVGLNLVLIPRFSYFGASWSWFATNVVALMIGFWLARRVIDYQFWPFCVSLGKVILSVGLMAWFTIMTRPLLPLVPVVLFSGLIYLIILLILRELTFVDIKYFVNLFRKPTVADAVLPPLTEV
ncbi:hypothetical protein A3E96_02330 [Candidatus Uhrbacteria bacterium RIFCSPHIGHO2_12_FULL_46_13]|uniref:Uncharacterized protein n=1 Tax=Candidatus Uhrbacteria bacterium RIFCSPLOWO2_01_FULL_47_25 TaxID=1802402 RepID=A0A1F7UXY8_9BACT|nr:MAG: Polysaccharide biosynthesis protein [Parcubacteria group bacterium GW2011_GWA2_46_9]OGL61377.1 MAG: hypothetical protein A2752_01685 [Candidatus Uhrbacteria bacterium RIFCSPHIGHO2_01_FULL_46_23]OGL70655.1 MAG: hypothetical protein A3D60_04310 [Candidatus Uhrbacteria bacterium RIFCSPHIGHO2_02_FULL_47_29]OGL76421.1 MAG: hypothetical protein A3E96_02330 [Candidatus Uhrbacteria bacterium RIFCSPHIGHO2_12_FULL_46_13]OGL83162.1 MAG: hypothetical protein A2936_01530 [Candidatus Uhrbacteria bact